MLYKLRALEESPGSAGRPSSATYYFIRSGDVDDTFGVAELLVDDPHELVQKATGSWLREAGKRDPKRLVRFLERHAATMPRTTLRYAVEKLNKTLRDRVHEPGKDQERMNALRAMARLAVVAGAIGASVLMLYVGRRNQHYWLLVMFVRVGCGAVSRAWLRGPLCGALVGGDARDAVRRDADRHRRSRSASYVDVVVRPRPQPAAPFFIMPVVAWLIMADRRADGRISVS